MGRSERVLHQKGLGTSLGQQLRACCVCTLLFHQTGGCCFPHFIVESPPRSPVRIQMVEGDCSIMGRGHLAWPSLGEEIRVEGRAPG